MRLKEHLKEIAAMMAVLPEEKIAELQDFARFLKDRYGKEEALEYKMDWTEEDLNDLAEASWQYGDETLPWDGHSDDTK